LKPHTSCILELVPKAFFEIDNSYIKLIDEIQRAGSPKYTVAQAYKRGYTFEFGSDPAGINLYLDHRFEFK